MSGYRRFVSVTSIAALVLVACSSAPGDDARSSDEALMRPPPRQLCVMETPAGSTSGEYVVAWARAPIAGAADGCPDVRGADGLWAQLGKYLPTEALGRRQGCSYNGVPGECGGHLGSMGVPNCRFVAGMPANCCTYVWWPDGLANNPNEANPPSQESYALCDALGGSFVAIAHGLSLTSPLCDAGECNAPGGGGCSSCTLLNEVP